MLSVETCSLPEGALLEKFSRCGAYTDCFSTTITATVTHPQYVLAFYTTAVFKLERLILKWALSKPSTDIEAKQLAQGEIHAFAAWTVESRSENQLLMCDIHGRTRSWLMVAPDTGHGEGRTRLYFGSAIVPVKNPRSGATEMGTGFRALLGFHKVYSVILLYVARLRLERQLA